MNGRIEFLDAQGQVLAACDVPAEVVAEDYSGQWRKCRLSGEVTHAGRIARHRVLAPDGTVVAEGEVTEGPPLGEEAEPTPGRYRLDSLDVKVGHPIRGWLRTCSVKEGEG